MRKFATITSTCTVLVFSALAHSQQQIDIAVGGSIVTSARSNTSSVTNVPLQEKGGTYPSVSVNARLKDHLGLNVETAWRYEKASYYGYESYRPILMDANVLFQQKLPRKLGIDLLGGIGFASNRFYLPGMTSCAVSSGICYTSSTHFMEHLGAGIHYYFLGRFFVRPEAHYYHIQDNQGFYSDNLLRVGASIGYTIGSK